MTEEKWLLCKKPGPLVHWVQHRFGDRKLRLFGCACCRRIWELMPEPGRLLVESSELLVDGLTTAEANGAAKKRVRSLVRAGMPWRMEREEILLHTALRAAVATTQGGSAELVIETGSLVNPISKEWRAQRALLHEIFGNPFRPLPPRPEAIAPLAERIYAGEWNMMPILGEWLQENGYWSEGEHCLDPKNQHVKGCWVVDWVTGRE